MSTTMPSNAIKLTQICFAILFCLTCAGVCFGFAALKPILIAEGVYSDYCRPGERTRNPATGAWNACEDQDTRLNFMFTLAVTCTNTFTLPIGFTLDRIGPKRTSILGAVLFALGCFSFGLGYRSAWLDSYFLGFALLALGGPLIFLPSFHLSNAFPAYSGLILAAVTGAFDASSIPFVLYKAAYEKLGGAISIRLFFWCYTVFPALVVVEQLTLAPSTIYQRGEIALVADEEEEESVDEVAVAEASAFESMIASANAGLTGSSFSRVHYGDAHNDDDALLDSHTATGKDQLTGTMFDRSAKDQICSVWFVVLTAFVTVHMLRINWYIMTVRSQVEFFTGDAALAETLTTLFTVVLPLGGALGIPFVGWLLDSRPWLDVSTTLLSFGLLFGLLGLTPSPALQIAGIAVFCLFRPLMYTAVSDAFARVFGFAHFGTVYGLAMSTSGVVGMVNAPLDVWVKGGLRGDFVPVDAGYVGVGALTGGVLVWMVWRGTRQGRVQLE